MAISVNPYFGFDSTQQQTLENLLSDAAAGVPATTATRGTVLQAAARANSAAADVAALNVIFNDLLAKLRTAGILAT